MNRKQKKELKRLEGLLVANKFNAPNPTDPHQDKKTYDKYLKTNQEITKKIKEIENG